MLILLLIVSNLVFMLVALRNKDRYAQIKIDHDEMAADLANLPEDIDNVLELVEHLEGAQVDRDAYRRNYNEVAKVLDDSRARIVDLVNVNNYLNGQLKEQAGAAQTAKPKAVKARKVTTAKTAQAVKSKPMRFKK